MIFWLILYAIVLLYFNQIMPAVLFSGVYFLISYLYYRKGSKEPILLIIITMCITVLWGGYSIYKTNYYGSIGKQLPNTGVYAVSLVNNPTEYKTIQIIKKDYEDFMNGKNLVVYDKDTFKKITYKKNNIENIQFYYDFDSKDVVFKNKVRDFKRLYYEYNLYFLLFSSILIVKLVKHNREKNIIKTAKLLYSNYKTIFDNYLMDIIGTDRYEYYKVYNMKKLTNQLANVTGKKQKFNVIQLCVEYAEKSLGLV